MIRVLYYNAETRKILTLCNYTFLITQDIKPLEKIQVALTLQREGECEGNDTHTVEDQQLTEPKRPTELNPSHKRKEPPCQDEPRRTKGIRKDFRWLADPFLSDKDDNDDNENNEDGECEIFVMMAEAKDEFQTLKEAKESSKWPEWERTICVKLIQHREKGRNLENDESTTKRSSA